MSRFSARNCDDAVSFFIRVCVGDRATPRRPMAYVNLVVNARGRSPTIGFAIASSGEPVAVCVQSVIVVVSLKYA
jgi:hypothetical protein